MPKQSQEVLLQPTILGGTGWGDTPSRFSVPPEDVPPMPLTDTTIKQAKIEAKPHKLSDEKGMFL